MKGERVVVQHKANVRGKELRVKYACHQSIVLSGEEGATCYRLCGECFGDEQNGKLEPHGSESEGKYKQ